MARFPIGPLLQFYGFQVPTGAGWRRMKCVEHGDSHASASVNHTVGRWACLACNLHEDAIEMAMRREGLTFKPALEFCENATGTPDAAPPPPGRRSRRRVGEETEGQANLFDGRRRRR